MSSSPSLLSLLHEHSRAGHATLNKSVVPRVPLCLPPHATDSCIYAAGMTVFSHMYAALEETWDGLLLEESGEHGMSAGQRSALVNLKDDALIRSKRLDNDLKNIRTSLQPLAIRSLDALKNRSAYVHTTVAEALRAKPHLVLSYAYALYLGLFNGGRWISGLLLNADSQFWQEEDKEVVANTYLSFWYFDDTPRNAQHGQKVKLRFRETLDMVACDLTAAERQEIIEGTEIIFALCADLVGILDEYVLELMQQSVATAGMTSATAMTTTVPVPVSASAPPPGSGSALNYLFSGKLMQSAWYSVKSLVGRSPPSPTQLRNSFEQHA